MSNGMPSMVALLGLLAVAGFQNRDKLGSLLNGAGQQAGLGQQSGGLGGMLGNVLGGSGGLGGLTGGSGGLGGLLSGGLGGLLDHFNQSDVAPKAQSWVRDGANEPIEASELERSLGPDTIDQLVRQTGLSKQELLERLSKTLPEAVNAMTPNGRVPTEEEAHQLFQA